MASNGYPQQGENTTQQSATATHHASGSSAQPPDQVGWYFVQQYYTILAETPDQISLFYNKKLSSLVWGTEGEVQPMDQGRHEISERIKSLNFKNCKVRVTNVDSQASANNGILIQVMGEMTNDKGPSKRFAQTFFLAEQPNGYFVMNDIFRYLKEDEPCMLEDFEDEAPPDADEEATVELEPEPVPVEEAPVEEPVEEVQEISTAAEVEPEPEQQKPEEPITIAPAVPEIPAAVPTIIEATNGTPTPQEPEPEPEKASEEPEAAPESAEEALPASPAPQVESPVVTPAGPTPVPTPPPQQTQVEKPPAAAPTPAPAPVSSAPVAKPTWASLLNPKPAAPAAPAVPAVPAVSPAPQPTPPPAAAQPPPAAQSNAAQTVTTPTSASSGQGWQVSEGTKRHGRPTSIAGSGDLQNQAYIKNVTESVDINALKEALSKYGIIKNVEVVKQRNCAFVEFESASSIKAAKSAGPIQVGGQVIQVEERRAPSGRVGGPGGYGPRSPAIQRGDGRQGQGRGNYQRVEGRFDNRDARDGGRGGPRGGNGRAYSGRGRGGAAATN